MKMTSIVKLFNASLLVLLISAISIACSKQEEAQTPDSMPESAQPMPESTSAESASEAPATETMKEDEASMEQQNAETTTTESATAEPAKTETVVATESNTAPTAETSAPENTDELALARKSGCLACHSVEKKIIGPAWRDVAKRYKTDPDAKNRLIKKVAKGGSGNWKEVVGAAAMPPYSPRVSDENIERLVDFVLSLEK